MTTITKLGGVEYLLRSVADGVEDYFMGAGEAPGVWHGRWADRLGLTGVVEADAPAGVGRGRAPDPRVPLTGRRERRCGASGTRTRAAPSLPGVSPPNWPVSPTAVR